MSGTTTLLIIVLAAALSALLYLDWRNQQDMTAQHQRITEEMEIQSYIQSLPLDRRPRLIMPRALRERVVGMRGRMDSNEQER